MSPRALACAIVSLPAVFAAFSASAQTTGQAWPAKAVRVIVPFAPGGGADLTARPISQKLSENLGQQFIVDNRGGAAGAIGMELTARAPPDGYTIMNMSGSYSVTPATHKLSFDPFEAIVPVVEICYTPNVLVVHPSLPVGTTRELINFARTHKGQVVYASSGIGGYTHLATALFASMAGISMVHVPYKSTGAAMPELVAGQTHVMVASLLGARPYYESGRLRALAVSTAQRWPSLPQLPAIAETVPGYEAQSYYGIFAPKGTPQSIVERLNAEVNKILQDGSVRKLLEAQGLAPSGGPPAALGARVKKEYDGWVKIVREIKLKIE